MYMGAGLKWSSAMMSERAMRDLCEKGESAIVGEREKTTKRTVVLPTAPSD
jgi:hypothetical protein